ncbi:forkhead-associated domain-containing protein 1-like isoform X2 [Mobula birostris]|uniref:forkhead-associated domain-containing protein 1-like isoform X2 n=1 Tax=Mobula birostris TaxID=1983395 RepID=UPI003B28A8C7
MALAAQKPLKLRDGRLEAELVFPWSRLYTASTHGTTERQGRAPGGGTAERWMSGNEMKGFLKGSSEIHPLKAKTTYIGRLEDSDVCLKNGGIEDRHALIELSDTENWFVLQDLNSVNGTFVNDCRIQNAAVRLAPGDVLRFGIGGDTYEMVVETVPSVLCPPVSQRSAWPGHLQLIEDARSYSTPATTSQLPTLSTLSSASAPGGLVQGGSSAVPRPPLRKRAASAGTRRVATTYCTDSSGNAPAVTRGAWTNTPGRSVENRPPISTFQSLELLLHEKEQQILGMQGEISRLAVFESKSKHKDGIIVTLRDEVAALRHQLTEANNDESEITQRIVTLGCEIKAKKEEIEMLKDQITKLQKGSSEVMRHSLTERDLEIAKLKKEAEQLKKDNNIITGLVTSLQREVTAKEHQLLQVNVEVEGLRKIIQEKSNQLADMSAKFSRMREANNHQEELVAKEKELVTQRHNVKQLESRLKEMESEIEQLRGQQDNEKRSASEERLAREQLQDELERTRLQLQEMGRRERLVRVDLEQAQARVGEQPLSARGDSQALIHTETHTDSPVAGEGHGTSVFKAFNLERFRSRILQTTYSAPGVQSPKEAVSDQQVIEEMTQIIDEREEFKEKLQEAMDLKAAEEEERLRNMEGLSRALEESEARLRTDFVNRVKQEFGTLQALSVDQTLLWVQNVVTGILNDTLLWLHQLEQSLVDAGIDVSSCEGGISGCLQLLPQKLHKAEEQVKRLQEQVDQMQNSRDREREEQLNALRAQCKQQMEEEFRHWRSEVQEQHKQQLAEALALEKGQLAEALALEKEKRVEAVEEEKRRHEETELRLQELRESAAVKCHEVETLKLRLNNTSQALDEARKMEVGLCEELAAQKRQQKAESQELRNRIEVEGRSHLQEVTEFKEQIRQHSLTIVALEERLLTVSKQQQVAEEERMILSGKLKDARKDPEEVERNRSMKQLVQTPSPLMLPTASDIHAQEQICSALQKELAECQMQILAQQDVIVGLRRDLAGANAKMSDLAGELSERQKVELEQNRSLVRSQALELSTLRQQLAKMSQLVDKKNEELQGRNTELRACKEKLEEQKATRKEKEMLCKKLQQELSERDNQPHQNIVHAELQDKVNSDLAMVAAQCKGDRHVEVIQRQREALAELRTRMRALEQAHTPRTSQEEALQNLMILKKELAALQTQRMLIKNKSPGSSLQSNDEAKVKYQGESFALSNASIERTSLLEMSETLDLSERTYLDLVKALSSLLNVKELTGSLSLKHVPQDERERLGKARQRDVQLLSGGIGQLKTQLVRKDELLGSYEKDLEQLRCLQITLHKKQADVEILQGQLQSQTEENGLLRESMERMQSHFDQEKRLNKANKQRKTIHVEQLDRKGSKFPSHSCVKEDIHGKAEARRKMMEEKLKRKDYEIEVLKRELKKQGQDLCDTTTRLINLENSLVCKHHAQVYCESSHV